MVFRTYTAVKRKYPSPLSVFVASNFARTWKENLQYFLCGKPIPTEAPPTPTRMSRAHIEQSLLNPYDIYVNSCKPIISLTTYTNLVLLLFTI